MNFLKMSGKGSSVKFCPRLHLFCLIFRKVSDKECPNLNFAIGPAAGVASSPDAPLQSYTLLTTPLQSSRTDATLGAVGAGSILGVRVNFSQTIPGMVEISNIHDFAGDARWHTTITTAATWHVHRDLAPAFKVDLPLITGERKLELALQYYF